MRQVAARAGDHHSAHPQGYHLAVPPEPSLMMVTAVEVQDDEPARQRCDEQNQPQPASMAPTGLGQLHDRITGASRERGQ